MTHFPPGAVIAAGAIVWREREGSLEVLAVHRPRYDDWSWPKGKLEPGETLPACAVREITEETGVDVALGVPLPTLRYPISGGKVKVVRYWSARVIKAKSPAVKARPAIEPAAEEEIDNTAWLTIEEARERITFPEDLRPLERLVELHAADRLNTRAFILARHARAKRRKAWNGNDEERPLTKGGAARAEQLVELFAAFGPAKVTSSPAKRCMDTVQPFAQRAGLAIKNYAALTERRHSKKPNDTAEVFSLLLGDPKNRIVCVHRPTLPGIVSMLRAFTSGSTRGALPRKMPFLPAGGVLVAHIKDTDEKPVIVALETHLLKIAL